MSRNTGLGVSVGSRLNERYRVEAVLGEGAFAIVTKCYDRRLNRFVAVKVNKNNAEAAQQAQDEISVLRRLQRLDANACCIVKCLGVFHHLDSTCIRFELLDQSLQGYLDDRHRHPLPVMEAMAVVQQLATALHHLKAMGIVHADVKPENVMVVNRQEKPLRVKLIDFGVAFDTATGPDWKIGTVWYTAPEVILGLPLDEAVDMWALGQTTVILVCGYPLYPGEDYYQVLSFIQETQGPLPEHMLGAGRTSGRYFHYRPRNLPRWQFKTPEERELMTGTRLQGVRFLKCGSIADVERHVKMKTGVQCGQGLLVDLLHSMLQLDPRKRIEPLRVLQHAIFLHPLFQLNRGDTDIEGRAATVGRREYLGYHTEEEGASGALYPGDKCQLLGYSPMFRVQAAEYPLARGRSPGRDVLRRRQCDPVWNSHLEEYGAQRGQRAQQLHLLERTELLQAPQRPRWRFGRHNVCDDPFQRNFKGLVHHAVAC